MVFLVDSLKYLKKIKTPILHKLFQKLEEERKLPTPSLRSAFPWHQSHKKSAQEKETNKQISLMNIHTKILSKY